MSATTRARDRPSHRHGRRDVDSVRVDRSGVPAQNSEATITSQAVLRRGPAGNGDPPRRSWCRPLPPTEPVPLRTDPRPQHPVRDHHDTEPKSRARHPLHPRRVDRPGLHSELDRRSRSPARLLRTAPRRQPACRSGTPFEHLDLTAGDACSLLLASDTSLMAEARLESSHDLRSNLRELRTTRAPQRRTRRPVRCSDRWSLTGAPLVIATTNDRLSRRISGLWRARSLWVPPDQGSAGSDAPELVAASGGPVTVRLVSECQGHDTVEVPGSSPDVPTKSNNDCAGSLRRTENP